MLLILTFFCLLYTFFLLIRGVSSCVNAALVMQFSPLVSIKHNSCTTLSYPFRQRIIRRSNENRSSHIVGDDVLVMSLLGSIVCVCVCVCVYFKPLLPKMPLLPILEIFWWLNRFFLLSKFLKQTFTIN